MATDLDGATEHGDERNYPSDPGEFAARWNGWTENRRAEWLAAVVELAEHRPTSDDEAQPWSWQVTRTDDAKVSVVLGDQWPKNDGPHPLTEESYTAVSLHTVGRTLRKVADSLIDQSVAISHGDDDGWDD